MIGAELNSEIEHQTAKDSTTGKPKPMGKRGAWAADHVAGGRETEADTEGTEEGPSLGSAGPPLPTGEKAAPE